MRNITKKVSILSLCMILLVALFAGNGLVRTTSGLTPGFDDELDDDMDIGVTDPTIPDEEDPSDTPPGEDGTDTDTPSIEIPERFRSALQAYNYAMNYLNNATGVYSVTSGTTNAAVATQAIKGYKKIDKDGNFFTESTSKKTSTIGVDFAEQIYIPKGEDKIYYKTTSSVNDDLTANYDDNETVYTTSEYLSEYYVLPNQSNYVINQSTIESSRIRYSASEERYYGSFVLNELAVEQYKYKLMKSSSSSTVPKFSSITLEFILDKYGRFLSIVTNDVCSATVVIGVTINTSIKEIFKSYNDPDIIIERGGN